MMEELTLPVELTDEELDLVAAGCGGGGQSGNSGGNLVLQINVVDIGGSQQNSNNGSNNFAL